jgi:hypothetical protein
MRSKISSDNDITFEWIPYNHFCNIEEIGKGGFAKVYSATWIVCRKKYDIAQIRKVALKCLYKSQNITSKFLNEV